jgi:lysophospholipase L1-like esterase
MVKMYKPDVMKTIFRFVAPIVIVILIFSALELFSWFYILHFSIPTNSFDFRMSRPEPYKNAPFFSEEFVKEAFFQPGGWNVLEKTGDISPKDFSGRYFNTSDGIRKTCFQPEKFENKVYIFGDSTVYGSEVPDEHTIPSQLQIHFNKFYPEKYIVLNYGITSFSSDKQLKMLKTVNDLKQGDIVIFYEGINEVFVNIFYANINSSYMKFVQNDLDALSWLLKIMVALSERSYFAKLFLNPVDYAVPEHLSDDVFVKKMTEQTRPGFTRDIIAAHSYSTKSGAQFFHFLQPHFFADDTYTEYEEKIKNNKYLTPTGIEGSFKKGYEVLQKANAELAESMNSVDLTEILNEHKDGEEYFLDYVHVNHSANKIIAENIFRHIRKELSTLDKHCQE